MQNNKHQNTINKPFVSVIMPVYNASLYLEEAIESVLNQTYTNFELIIVDDASKDNSWKIIRRFQNRFKRKIVSVRLKKNRNCGGDLAGNLAFTKAKGEFIARFDADDIANPDRLSKQVKYMLQHKECAVLGSSAEIIDKTGKVIGQKTTLANHQDIYDQYFTYHPMINPSLMIRRSMLLDKETLYKIELNSNNDYLTFFTMITSGLRFANISEPLIKYRMHGKNDSLSQVKRTFGNVMAVRNKMVREGRYSPSLLAWFKSLLQMLVVGLLPDALVFRLYLISRGIYSPKEILAKLFNELKNAFAFNKNISLKDIEIIN
ncbi:MAG: glycosyltransferase family 2 protein [Patescibacteria group bacterium]